MNQLTIKELITDNVSVEQLSQVMDQEKVEYNAINCVNWDTYPYQPNVKFRIAHSQQGILLNYQVEEDSVRAKYGEDDGDVWTDSCVEFFLIPANDGVYYNIETNCIGTVLIGAGATRNGRERAPKEITQLIKRHASLGHLPFAEKVGKCTWNLSLIIPYTAFFKHNIESLDGATIRANFYKCGDELQQPHFLSWNAIEIEKPDFHRPDFFGEISFK